MRILTKEKIVPWADSNLSSLLQAQRMAFIQYSAGSATVPPVGHLYFTDPPGDSHVKYGYVKSSNYFVIKVSNGFYNNSLRGLPTNNGCNLVFSKLTGELKAVLLDEGYLTTVRTALAVSVVATAFFENEPLSVGCIGTGEQALKNIQVLNHFFPNLSVRILGRPGRSQERFICESRSLCCEVRVENSLQDLVNKVHLLITCTPSRQPVLTKVSLPRNLVLIAQGADGGGKHEVDPALVGGCQRVVVDSRSQCFEYGDTSYALQTGQLDADSVLELGEFLENAASLHFDASGTWFFDLTGVAVQDIAISEAVLALP